MNTIFLVILGFISITALSMSTAFLLLYRKHIKMRNKFIKANVLRKRQMAKANYFESILQDSKDIIFTIDDYGYILKFNRGAEIDLGYSQAEIVGQPLSILFPDQEEQKNLLNEVSDTGVIKGREVAMKTKSGIVIYTDFSISKMSTEYSASINGMVITCKNSTLKKRMEQELLEKNRLLEELAITDNLSGLYNVRHFHKEIAKEIARLKRNYISNLSILLLDIDKFKELNDTLGHKAGDNVIQVLGNIILSCIRRDLDNGFRYGGDEFVVLLPEADIAGAKVIAGRIINLYNTKKFSNTSLSIGISQIRKDQDEEEIVKIVDKAMYSAKREGGNRVHIKNN
ncbi:MAG: sensor domain-containing diguanylate cyclase [bacterium]